MKITKEQLEIGLLNWNPEILYATQNGKKLIMSIDIFNHHINWSVKYGDGYYAEFYEDYNKAFDFFLDN